MRKGPRSDDGSSFGWNRGARKSRCVVIAAAAVVFLLLTAPLAWGQTYTYKVLNNSDNSQTGSLRWAINQANAYTGSTPPTIYFDPSLEGQTITLQSGSLEITKKVDIEGPPGVGVQPVTISGNGRYTVFTIDPSTENVSVKIEWLTIEDGNSSLGNGGGIYNDATNLFLNYCTVQDCTAGGTGGGVWSNGNLDSQSCTFSGNYASSGGGIEMTGLAGGNIWDCTFDGNHATGAPGYGGGIQNYGDDLGINDCTFSGNTATYGGGMETEGNYSEAAVYDTILWGDTATTGGTEIYDADTTGHKDSLTIDTCVVPSDGIQDNGNITETLTGNIHADPLLGTLGNYGGLTETIPLLPGSSAIDAAVFPTGVWVLGADERGVKRPQGSGSDIGAFESQGFNLSIISGNNQNAEVNAAFADSLAVDVTSSYGEPVDGGVVTFAVQTSSTGATATLSGSPATISGEEAQVIATANGTAGGYEVSAAPNGASAVSFSLTNTSGEMTVKGNHQVIASGDTTPTGSDDTDFGSTDIVSGTVDRTFTIDSTGNNDFTLSSVQITGADASDFTVKAQPASSVAPENSTTLTIEFDPSNTGTRTATVKISNSTAENPYTFAIQGTGFVKTGDVNDDGSITILDVRLCLEIAQGVIPGTATQRQRADVNKDSRVTLADAQLLANYVAGIRTP